MPSIYPTRCAICGEEVKDKRAAYRHAQKHTGITFKCLVCDYETNRKDALIRHVRDMHQPDELAASPIHTPSPQPNFIPEPATTINSAATLSSPTSPQPGTSSDLVPKEERGTISKRTTATSTRPLPTPIVRPPTPDNEIPCPHAPDCTFRSDPHLMKIHVYSVHRRPDENQSYRQVAVRPSNHIKQMRYLQTTLEYKLTNDAVESIRSGLVGVPTLLEEVLIDVLEPYLGQVGMMLQVEIESDDVLNHSIMNAPIRGDQFDIHEYVERQFVNVLQSFNDLGTHEPLTIRVSTFPYALGGYGVSKQRAHDEFEFVRRKKSIWDPSNGANDNTCFGSCVVAGLRALNLTAKQLQRKDWYHKHALGPEFHTELTQLYENVGASRENMCGPVEWNLFQEFLDTLEHSPKLLILDLHNANEIIFGQRYMLQNVNKIHVLFSNKRQHYYFISNIKSYISPRQLCTRCGKTYMKQHSCRAKCKLCWSCECTQQKPPGAEMIRCQQCKRYFFNAECFANHERMVDRKNLAGFRTRVCDLVWNCLDCGKDYDPSKPAKNPKFPSLHHAIQCLFRICQVCNEHYRVQPDENYEPHLCYAMPPDPESLLPTKPMFHSRSRQNRNPENDGDELDLPVREEDFEPGFGPEDYINPIVADEAPDNENAPTYNYLFYDIETYKGVDGICYANLVVAQHVCSLCETSNDISVICPYYGARERIFSGPTANEDFSNFVFNDKLNRVVTCIAHNGSRFDVYFPQYYPIKNHIKPDTISKGNKVMMLSHGRRKFLDSMLWLMCRVADLPAMFGFEHDVVKDTFPHAFNVPENWHKRFDQLPALKYYETRNYKNKKAAAAFETWHTEHANDSFDFDAELERYCRADVTILRRACMEFRRLMIEICQLDPFHCSITIASMCSKVYRSTYMPPRKIGLVPPGGYSVKQAHSHIATCYMEWLNEKYRTNISHAGNRAHHEPTLAPGIRVDGVYLFDPNQPQPLAQPDDIDATINAVANPVKHHELPVRDAQHKKVINIHGCIWHGCPKCYPDADTTKNHKTGASMRALYESTQETSRKIRALGFELVEVWTCDIERERKRDAEMDAFFKTWRESPIGEREAFYGGRTNAGILRCCVTENDEPDKIAIHYVDFCSLYPTVQSREDFPYGHPERLPSDMIIPSSDRSNRQLVKRNRYPGGVEEPIFGVVKCKMLPPRDLLYPVLPIHCRGKMIFTLCMACATENNKELSPSGRSTACRHSDDERALAATWTSEEIRAAMQRGYRFLSASEALHYPERGQLFREYVRAFMKLKAEASGWPNHPCNNADCCTKTNACDGCELCMQARLDYIDEYERKEGIQLDPSRVTYSPGMRCLAKAMLTNLWGKLGENPKQSKTVYPSSTSDLHKTFADNNKKVSAVQYATEHHVCLSYTCEDSKQRDFYNPIIASFVTSYGRLYLLDAIERVGPENVLYFDTDSLIFKWPKSEELPITIGTCLGELASELRTNEYITRFVSTGPKSYAFETNLKYQKVTLKGITQSAATESGQLSIDTVEKVLMASLGRANLGIADVYKQMSDVAEARAFVKDHMAEIIAHRNIYRSETATQRQKETARAAERELFASFYVAQKSFVKDKATSTIRINATKKKFKSVYDKRVVRKDFSTVPFGFVDLGRRRAQKRKLEEEQRPQQPCCSSTQNCTPMDVHEVEVQQQPSTTHAPLEELIELLAQELVQNPPPAETQEQPQYASHQDEFPTDEDEFE